MEMNGKTNDDLPDMFEGMNDNPQNTTPDGEPGTFEEILKRLETIVAEMEGGGLSLEESIKLYEEGISRAGSLTAMLRDTREKVMKLVQDRNGDVSVEPFDEGEGE